MSSTETQERPAAVATGVTRRHRGEWSEEQINLILATTAKGATRATLMWFLEVAAMLDLSPFTRDIWCIVGKTDGEYDQNKVQIIVGRDGMLTLANRSGQFNGMDSDTVRANDIFKVIRTPDGQRTVHHEYGLPKDRGAPVGAYAFVYRKDMDHPFYFFADWEEYKRTEGRSPWQKQKSAMIEKVAEHTALRRAFSISGVISEEEAQSMGLIEDGSQPVVGEPVVQRDEIDWGDDPVIARRLQDLFAHANAMRMEAFTVLQQKLRLDGKDEQGRLDLIADLEQWITQRKGTPPDWPTEESLAAEAAERESLERMSAERDAENAAVIARGDARAEAAVEEVVEPVLDEGETPWARRAARVAGDDEPPEAAEELPFGGEDGEPEA